jgi:hypothetical protein
MTRKRTAKDRPPVTIRPYAARDRAAVREINCRTAYRNRGHDFLFEDGALHADYWTSYFTDYRPEASWVVERDGRIIGYFLGCTDQAHFLRTMKRRIVPRIAALALWRSLTRYGPKSRRYVRFMLFTAPGETPDFPYLDFPAHYHCNITREGYGLNLYTTLALMFCDRLEALGVKRMHGAMLEPAGSAAFPRMIAAFGQENVEAYAEKPTRLFEVVAGDPRPMLNRVWGAGVPAFRRYFEWMRDHARM